MISTKTATAEEVWALIRENADGMKELRKSQQKTEEARREGEKVLREAQQQTERALQDLTKKLDRADGQFRNKWGKFLENLVKGDLIKILEERNIEITRIQPRTKIYKNKKEIGEFDLVAKNGEEIVVIEVKSTLTIEDVQKFIHHLKRFKEYFTEDKDKIIYGGVAYLCEPEYKEARGAATYAEENGLFVIVSPGGQSNVTTISNPKDFKPKAF